MAAAEALGGNGTTSAVMRTLFLPPAYQDSAEGCLILRDGFTGFVRLSESSDRDALRECFNPLSSESKRQRFFSIADRAEALLEQQCDSSNPRLQLTLIVSRIVKARPESFATGAYVARDEITGEFAFARGCFPREAHSKAACCQVQHHGGTCPERGGRLHAGRDHDLRRSIS